VDEAEIAESLARLDSLADDEYRMPLSDVIADEDATRSAARLGRLVGILLKEPFAEPTPRDKPSDVTGAYRSWLLVGEDAFNDPERQETWQYKTLEKVRSDLVSESPFFNDWSVWKFADYAGTERAFFGFFARAARRYICENAETKLAVDKALQASAVGKGAPLSAMIGADLVYHLSQIQFLGATDITLVVGLSVILGRIGLDGFCDWSMKLIQVDDRDEPHKI
jgi:nitrogen fixation-related uncharacterized protein